MNSPRGKPSRLKRLSWKQRARKRAHNLRTDREGKLWLKKHVVGKDEAFTVKVPQKRTRPKKGMDWIPTKYGGIRK